jgi:hypothetical protein
MILEEKWLVEMMILEEKIIRSFINDYILESSQLLIQKNNDSWKKRLLDQSLILRF